MYLFFKYHYKYCFFFARYTDYACIIKYVMLLISSNYYFVFLCSKLLLDYLDALVMLVNLPNRTYEHPPPKDPFADFQIYSNGCIM